MSDTSPGDTGGPDDKAAWAFEQDLGPSEPRPDDTPRISLHLARRLRDAGLIWRPAEGDRFVIPDRDLDDEVFWISPMSVDVRSGPAGRLITFNGAVEWALDAIEQTEAVWLPTEAQLRRYIDDCLLALRRTPEGYRCEVEIAGTTRSFSQPSAPDAYAHALLARLEHSSDPSP